MNQDNDQENIDALLDMLMNTIPRADAAYQTRLEKRLLHALQQGEDKLMQETANYNDNGHLLRRNGRRGNHLPLTLTAVAIMMLIALSALVGLYLRGDGGGDDPLSMAAMQGTTTAQVGTLAVENPHALTATAIIVAATAQAQGTPINAPSTPLCNVNVDTETLILRSRPAADARQLVELEAGQPLAVFNRYTVDDTVWFLVIGPVDQITVQGWLREDDVSVSGEPCPEITNEEAGIFDPAATGTAIIRLVSATAQSLTATAASGTTTLSMPTVGADLPPFATGTAEAATMAAIDPEFRTATAVIRGATAWGHETERAAVDQTRTAIDPDWRTATSVISRATSNAFETLIVTSGQTATAISGQATASSYATRYANVPPTAAVPPELDVPYDLGPTPAGGLCTVQLRGDAATGIMSPLQLRASPAADAEPLALPPIEIGTWLNVSQVTRDEAGEIWYLVLGRVDGVEVQGWAPATALHAFGLPCPPPPDGELSAEAVPTIVIDNIDGRTLVTMPFNDGENGRLQPGDRVDMIVALRYVEVDDEFQAVLGETDATDGTEPLVFALGTSVDESVPQTVVQRVIADVEIADIPDAQTIILVVDPQKAIIIEWLIEAQVPYTILQSSITAFRFEMGIYGNGMVEWKLVMIAARDLNTGENLQSAWMMAYWPVAAIPDDAVDIDTVQPGTLEITENLRLGEPITEGNTRPAE